MTEYYIWLQQCFGAANVKAYNAIRDFGGAEAFYRACENGTALKLLSDKERSRIKTFDIFAAEKLAAECKSKGVAILTIDDAAYPERLRNIYAPPVVLYVLGELADTEKNLPIAMVGNRRPSPYGIAAAGNIAYDLADAGAVVVSGMALGIDAESHKGALKAGGKTIAVLGCGLDIVYPQVHAELMDIIKNNGGVISEFPFGTQPLPVNFPMRNRIISGLSLGVVVVEAGMHSGSLITANLALEQGKDIFTVPNSIYSEHSAGAMKLLRDGAIPAASAYDVLIEYEQLDGDRLSLDRIPKRYFGDMVFATESEINRELSQKKAKAQKNCEQLSIAPALKPAIIKKEKNLPEYLSQNALLVYDILSERKIHVDDISEQLNIQMSAVLSALTELELEELVRSYAGRFYSL